MSRKKNQNFTLFGVLLAIVALIQSIGSMPITVVAASESVMSGKRIFNLSKNWATENGYSEKMTLDRIDYDGNYEPGNRKAMLARFTLTTNTKGKNDE